MPEPIDYNVIDEVVRFNEKRNLTTFNPDLEFGFILEELFEGIGVKDAVYTQGYDKEQFRELIKLELEFTKRKYSTKHVTPAEQADAFGDIIVFAIGAIHKLCLANPELGDVTKVMLAITNANNAKGNKVDKDGKLIKDDNFIEPVF